MTMNIDAKFEGKLTCTFKNDMKNLATRSIRGSTKTLFYPGNKWTAQLTQLFTYVLMFT